MLFLQGTLGSNSQQQKKRIRVMLPKPNRVLLHPCLCQDLHYQSLPTPHPPHCHNPPYHHLHSVCLLLCPTSLLVLSSCPRHPSQMLHLKPPATPMYPPLRKPHQSPRRLFPQSCFSPHCSLIAQLRNWLLLPASLSDLLLLLLLLLHQPFRHPFPH